MDMTGKSTRFPTRQKSLKKGYKASEFYFYLNFTFRGGSQALHSTIEFVWLGSTVLTWAKAKRPQKLRRSTSKKAARPPHFFWQIDFFGFLFGLFAFGGRKSIKKSISHKFVWSGGQMLGGKKSGKVSQKWEKFFLFIWESIYY